MSSITFNPDTDIPSLAGKVIFITGGKYSMLLEPFNVPN
jgi:hypothetical protein